MQHQAGYGRPFPPRYKDLYADRGCTAGEHSMQGKRLDALDVVIVPLEGARYDCHGIKYHPAVLLTRVDVEASLKKIAEVASRHASLVSAFASLGYDTPGYGYGTHDGDGTPSLQKGLAALAREYGADGTPITTMTVEVLDQSMLHGLLAQIRDLGLPLIAVTRIEPVQNSGS